MANFFPRDRNALLPYGFVICTLVFVTACDPRMSEAGPTRNTVIALNKDAIDHANIELNMNAGELKLSGGTDKLINGRFEFNVAADKPTVRSTVNGSHATVTIRQVNDGGFSSHERNIWDLQLNEKALLDLSLNCGAGQATMNVGSLNLRLLQVHMGAGQVDLDLTGHPQRDYDVEIAGGVGQATIHLPQGVGIRADVHGGLGSINVSGLEKKDGHYENDSYETARVNVRLKVTGGIGEIRIED